MQVKRFVAADMRRALELVRQQLGPDAIILSSNRTAKGVELLTTTGSDNELMQLQQQPLGKMSFASASPMISDNAWSDDRAIHKHEEQLSEMAAKHANQSRAGKNGRQLADDIEQARLRMMAARKAEESAKEFLVGKNTRVNAGIPRYSNPVTPHIQFTEAPRQEPLPANLFRQEMQFNQSNYQEQYPSYQDQRHTSFTSQPQASAVTQPQVRVASPAPQEASVRVDDTRKSPAPRPVTSKVSVPKRRNPVPRPVLVERAPEPVVAPVAAKPITKPKSAMTAAERYPLIDDEPELVVAVEAPVVAEPVVTAVAEPEVIVEANAEIKPQAKIEVAVEKQIEEEIEATLDADTETKAEAQLEADVVNIRTDDIANVEAVAVEESVTNTEKSEIEMEADNSVQATGENPVVDADADAISSNKYFLELQSELAGMRFLLEQQFSRLHEVNAAANVKAPLAAVETVAEVVVEENNIANQVSEIATPVEKVEAVVTTEETLENAAEVVEASVETEVAEPIVDAAHETLIDSPFVDILETFINAEVIDDVVTVTDIDAHIAEAVTETVSDDLLNIPTLSLDDIVIDEAVAGSVTRSDIPKANPLSFQIIGEVEPEVEQAPETQLSTMAETADTQVTAADATMELMDEDFVEPQPDNSEYLLELQTELADMRFLLEQQFNRMDTVNSPAPSASIMGSVGRRLARAGLPEDVVSNIVSEGTKTHSLSEAWPEAMANLAHQLPVIGRDIVDEGGVFAFVGPTGVGKTTTIGKLAARYVLKHGADKVALITTDTYRIASHEQLRSIARILRVPVKVVDEDNSLESLLISLSHYEVVLIDTAGFRHGEPQLKTQLTSLAALPQVKTFVVLSTNCQAQMLKATVHAHGLAGLHGCVLTKLDETSSLGESLGVVIKGWLPVAYTTDGQDIPADIDVARSHNLVSKAVAMIKKTAVSAVS